MITIPNDTNKNKQQDNNITKEEKEDFYEMKVRKYDYINEDGIPDDERIEYDDVTFTKEIEGEIYVEGASFFLV